MSFYAVWNLDFWHGGYELFCLHPDMSILQTISLDCVIAVYPLVLIYITYCLVRLHDRYIVFSRLWLPVYRCCYNEHGDKTSGFHLFINGSLIPFSKEHTPYAMLAIVMLFIFNFLPLVPLCVYPSHCFQKCLNRTKCQYRTLHAFMDTFQGCYKETPRDCRYFASFYLFLRHINLIMLSVSKNPTYLSLAAYVVMIASLLVAIFKPYKQLKRNTIDIIIFLIAITMCVTGSLMIEVQYIAPRSAIEYNRVIQIVLTPVVAILPLYGLCLLIYRVVSLLKIGIPDCGCPKTKGKLLKKKGITLGDSFPPYDDHNECSPLISNGED